MHLLERAERCGAAILQASTSEVYGDPDVHPQPESYWGNVNPIGPRACYDEGKRAAETLFFDMPPHPRRAHQGRAASSTPTVRGCTSEDGRIVSNFIVQALRGEPLTVYGDGRQTRSFCYVDDMVRALVALMESGEDVVGPVNLGNPEELPVIEVARARPGADRLARRAIEFHPLPIDDPRRRRPRSSARGRCSAGGRRSASRTGCSARSPTSPGWPPEPFRLAGRRRPRPPPERARGPAVLALAARERR